MNGAGIVLMLGGGALFGMAVVILIEKSGAILRYLRPPRFRNSSFGHAVYVAQRNRLVKDLLADTYGPPARYPGVSRIEMWLAHRRTRAALNWPKAMAYIAAFRACACNGCASKQWTLCLRLELLAQRIKEGAVRPQLPEDCMFGEAMLLAEELTGGTVFRQAATEVAEWLLESAEKHGGVLPYRLDRPELELVDTLGLVCPFLFHWGCKESRPQAIDVATNILLRFVENACDEHTGFPYHAYNKTGGYRLGVAGWLRGCGWYASGLMAALRSEGLGATARGALEKAALHFFRSLMHVQRGDGCWGWMLGDPYCEVDSSGSAMVAASLGEGIAAGFIESSAMQCVMNAADGIARRTDELGAVHQSQGNTYWVGLYALDFRKAVWGQAAAVTLGAVLQDLHCSVGPEERSS